jgi:hypothetical protein
MNGRGVNPHPASGRGRPLMGNAKLARNLFSLCLLKEDQIRHKKLTESTACSACFAKYCLRRERGPHTSMGRLQRLWNSRFGTGGEAGRWIVEQDALSSVVCSFREGSAVLPYGQLKGASFRVLDSGAFFEFYKMAAVCSTLKQETALLSHSVSSTEDLECFLK